MSQDRGREAAVRRQEAEERAAELHQLRERLEHGEPLTSSDLELADRRMSQSARHAEEAHQHAASAHERAADAHRQAAGVADQVGRTDRADFHRRAALDDDAASTEEHQAEEHAVEEHRDREERARSHETGRGPEHHD